MSIVNSDALLRRIQMHQRLHPTVILHYHPPSRDLGAWFWPVTEAGRRVPPSDLSDYRIGYDFRAPCCLCASNPNSFGFTESEIYRALSGPYEGEYVAGCAADICGYITNLERMYPMRGLLLRKYPIRPPAAAPTLPMSIQTATPGSASSRSTSLNGSADPLLASIATYARPVKGPETAFDRFLRLDSDTRPGLYGPEFNRLFAKCSCGLIMTRRVFRNHVCAMSLAVVRDPHAIINLMVNDVTPRTVIDLTVDDVTPRTVIDLTVDDVTPRTVIDLTIDSEDESQ